MANFNSVHLIGRLTADPKLRHTTTGGTAVTEISLAINREFTVSDGSRRKEAVFVDIVFWARKAEIVAEVLKKGAQIFVHGRLELDRWEGPDKQKRSRLRVVAEGFQFLDRIIEGEHDDEDEDENKDESPDQQEWDRAARDVPATPEPTD